MAATPWRTVGRAFRRTALPLVAYYALTLAIPFANGAAQTDAFVKHALVVLVVPLVVTLLLCVILRIVHVLEHERPRIWLWLRSHSAR
jgi:hypothetical protein